VGTDPAHEADRAVIVNTEPRLIPTPDPVRGMRQLALLRETARAMGAGGEYDVLLGIEWTGEERLVIETTDGSGFRYDDMSVPLGRFAPVRSSLRVDLDDEAYLAQVAEVALDAINQGGVQNLQMLPMP
jgi:hypothetical protein